MSCHVTAAAGTIVVTVDGYTISVRDERWAEWLATHKPGDIDPYARTYGVGASVARAMAKRGGGWK